MGSYVFYAFSDWRFLVFLVGVSVLNFYLGIGIQKASNPKIRRLFPWIGLLQGVGSLVFFKYFNFFIVSFKALFSSLGFQINIGTLNILIPLGISYFTFKTISYLLDVDKGKIEATRNWLTFFNYVAFFPTLLVGPIDLGRNFIPQLEQKRKFSYNGAADGLRQILWGFFKKMVIADNLALIVNPIFDQYSQYSSISLLIGAFFFAIQLYTDFSGYSDMAIGFGRLLGFRVTRNFDFPFFAQNIAEFWRKWHISLTAWLTEYVFTPLSIVFRDWSKIGLMLAILINFIIIGLWHGANWTYVLFGFIHGCLFIPLILRGTMNKRKKENKKAILPTWRQFINMTGTFVVVMFSFILFRSKSISDAFEYLTSIFTHKGFKVTNFQNQFWSGHAFVILFVLVFLFLLEWLGRSNQYAIEKTGERWPVWLRWLFYAFILFLIGMFSPTSESPFIYLKF